MATVDVLKGANMLTTGGSAYSFAKDIASVKASVIGTLYENHDLYMNDLIYIG